MGIIIKNSAGTAGHERMVIKTSDPSGGHLILFPGTNQVVLSSIGLGGSLYQMYKSTDSGDSYNALSPDFPAFIAGNNSVSFNNRYYYVGDPSTIDGYYWLARSNDFGSTFTYDVSNAVSIYLHKSDQRKFGRLNGSATGFEMFTLDNSMFAFAVSAFGRGIVYGTQPTYTPYKIFYSNDYENFSSWTEIWTSNTKHPRYLTCQ